MILCVAQPIWPRFAAAKTKCLCTVFDWSLTMDWCLQVKAALLEKSKGIDRAEHVRKQREIKRFGKKARLYCVCCC
jgi:hypothetical protein